MHNYAKYDIQWNVHSGETLLDSGKRFGLWEVFLDSDKSFGFRQVLWILGSIMDSGKCFVSMSHRNGFTAALGLIFATGAGTRVHTILSITGVIPYPLNCQSCYPLNYKSQSWP